jgi:hypothetical protein
MWEQAACAGASPIYNPDQLSCLDYNMDFWGEPLRTFETRPPRKISRYRDDPVDVDKFKAWFSEFADDKKWPRALVEGSAKRARFYIPIWTQCDYLDGEDREYARGLLTAHIMITAKQNQASMNQPGLIAGEGGMIGGSLSALPGTGIVTSATIGGVSYSKTLPNSKDAYEFWLNQTPYGIELQAFLANHIAVGVMAQGDDIRECFRD